MPAQKMTKQATNWTLGRDRGEVVCHNIIIIYFCMTEISGKYVSMRADITQATQDLIAIVHCSDCRSPVPVTLLECQSP